MHVYDNKCHNFWFVQFESYDMNWGPCMFIAHCLFQIQNVNEFTSCLQVHSISSNLHDALLRSQWILI